MTAFHSTSLPYQASVPSGWTYQQLKIGGTIADGFLDQPINGFSTNINVLASPLNSQTTTIDYANSILGQEEQILDGSGSLTPTDVTVDGQTVIYVDLEWTLTEQGGVGTASTCQTMKCSKIQARTAVFIKDGTGWQVTLSVSEDADLTYTNQALAYLDQMLRSFELAQ